MRFDKVLHLFSSHKAYIEIPHPIYSVAIMNQRLFASFAVLLAALIYVWSDDSFAPTSAPRQGTAVAVAADSDARIGEAYRDRLSDIIVETSGSVIRLLPDDNQGSRHQRFIIRLRNNQSVLVSHNIDLAPRVEGLRVGDTILLRGEYVWNHQGGVIHWTHRDPQGRHPGGWIRYHEHVYE